MVDCKYVLLEMSRSSEEVVSACINAKYNIKSAYITGMIQFVSGMIVLVAAILTIKGTVSAAKIQIDPIVKKEDNRAFAYKKTILIVLKKVFTDVEVLRSHIEVCRYRYNKGENDLIITPNKIILPGYFDEQEWENNSLLGDKAIEIIYIIRNTTYLINEDLKSYSNVKVSEWLIESTGPVYDTFNKTQVTVTSSIARAFLSHIEEIKNAVQELRKELIDIKDYVELPSSDIVEYLTKM